VIGWYVTWVLWVLGGSLAYDLYKAEIEAQEMSLETLPSKAAFVVTVAAWPLIELYQLAFVRGEKTHGE
jgi:hypothetical protein